MFEALGGNGQIFPLRTGKRYYRQLLTGSLLNAADDHPGGFFEMQRGSIVDIIPPEFFVDRIPEFGGGAEAAESVFGEQGEYPGAAVSGDEFGNY